MTSDTPNIKFSMRAEKSTRNKDDLRVMIAGTLFCIFMLMMQKPIFWLYDFMYAEKPIVTATIQIQAIAGRERPMIWYDADSRQNVQGIWIASVYEADGEQARLFSRRGDGHYPALNSEDSPELWTWSSFFDNEKDDWIIPDVPVKPFIICVRYDVFTSDSNFNDNSPQYCSDVFDPKDMEKLP